MKRYTTLCRISVIGVLISVWILFAYIPILSQSTFNRNDSYDFRGGHYLSSIGLDPDNFNIHIESINDFRLFKLHVSKDRLTLGPTAICFQYRVDMNSDGVWEQDWTTSDNVVSYNYPNPPNGISANYTITVQIDFVNYIGQHYPIKTKTQQITIYSTPRVYVNNGNDAFIQIRDEDATSKIPVFMVEGFDPLNENFPELYYNLTWDLVNTDLYPNGYEVFVLNFHDGGKDMRVNADVVLDALNKIHDVCPNYKIVLAGLSMGGPISRYALAKTEGQGGTHNVGLFVSYDAPQMWAHVSPGLQDWIKDQDPGQGAVGDLQNNLKSVAAKQMMGYNTYDPDHTLHNSFYNELNALNGDGYPHMCYNGAVSNGNFNATWGYQSIGRELMTLKINDILIHDVSAVALDCGTGSMMPDLMTRRYGDIFSIPFIDIYYELEIYFNPVYHPTYSALDLVNYIIDNSTGNIVSFDRSKFDDYVVQTTPLQHQQLSTTTRSKINNWINLNFNIGVNYNLVEGGSVNSNSYPVMILHGIPITVQQKNVNVNGQQIVYNFASWEDRNISNPRTFYTSHDVSHTATMKGHLVTSSSNGTNGNNQRKVVTNGGQEHLVYESAGFIWYTQNFGSGWTNERQLSFTSTAKSPSIAITQGSPNYQINVVYEDVDQFNTSKRDIYYTTSTDLGNNWSYPVEIYDRNGWDAATSVTPPDSTTPVVTGETFPIVLWHYSNGVGWMASPDPGTGQGWVYNIQNTNNTSKAPAVNDLQNGYLALAYEQGPGSIYYAELYASSTIPSYSLQPTPISNAFPGLTNCTNPTVASANIGANVYVAWEGNNGSAHHIFAREKAGSFQSTIELIDGTRFESRASIGVDQNLSKVNLLWQSDTHIAKDSRYLATGSSWSNVSDRGLGNSPTVNDNASTYSPQQALWKSGSASPYTLNLPTIGNPSRQSFTTNVTATNSQRKLVRGTTGTLYLVYDSEGDIWFTKSTDNGSTWTIGTRISTGFVNCSYPAITESNGYLYAVWQIQSGPSYNVMYNYSTNAGSQWLASPLTLASGISPSPTPVIQANPNAPTQIGLMIAWRDNTQLKSAFTNVATPGTSNWTVMGVSPSTSSAENPSLLYIPNAYPNWNLAWNAGYTIYYAQYYGSWSLASSFNPPYANSRPSVAVPQNNNIHLVWQGECSNYLPCIVDNKNLNPGVYTAFYSSTLSYYSPSVTGHSGGRVTILWYDSQNNIDKVVYDGSNWGTPSSVTTGGGYVTASITNPPGGAAYSFWTTTTGPPYSIVTNSNGGPLQKGSAGWAYSRSVVIMSADRSNIASLELSPPVLITADGAQKSLPFMPVSDSMVCTSDNVWSAYQTQSFSLPYGFTQGTIVASRSMKIGGGSIFLPISFDIVNASTGVAANTQTIQPANMSDELALAFRAKSGTPLRLIVHPNVILGNNYSGMIIHTYTLNDTSAISKISLASVGYNMKPQDYALLPNYPNPFNPSTTIQYRLTDVGIVKLSVFNVLGQEVKRVIDEQQQAGYKSVNFDAANLPSGVYYVRLLVTDEFGKQLFMATEKLLLMK